jgi:hypothetical protein
MPEDSYNMSTDENTYASDTELGADTLAHFDKAAEAILSDFTFVHETPEERERRLDPSYEYEDDHYRAIVSALPSGQELLRRLPDQPQGSVTSGRRHPPTAAAA